MKDDQRKVRMGLECIESVALRRFRWPRTPSVVGQDAWRRCGGEDSPAGMMDWGIEYGRVYCESKSERCGE